MKLWRDIRQLKLIANRPKVSAGWQTVNMWELYTRMSKAPHAYVSLSTTNVRYTLQLCRSIVSLTYTQKHEHGIESTSLSPQKKTNIQCFSVCTTTFPCVYWSDAKHYTGHPTYTTTKPHDIISLESCLASLGAQRDIHFQPGKQLYDKYVFFTVKIPPCTTHPPSLASTTNARKRNQLLTRSSFWKYWRKNETGLSGRMTHSWTIQSLSTRWILCVWM